MIRNIFPLLILFHFFICCLLFAEENQDKTLPFKFLQVDTLSALSEAEYEKIGHQLLYSQGTVNQYLRVAKYLLVKNTAFSRKMAKRFLKESIRYYPDHTTLQSAYGTLLYYQGYVQMAIKHFEKATDLDNQNSLAWYYLGKLYQNKMEKLKNQVSSASTAITYSEYADDYYLKAERAMHHCMLLNYGGDSLATSLFWLYFEGQEYQKSIDLLNDYRFKNAGDWQRYKLLQMAYFYALEYQKSDSALKKFIKEVPQQERWLYEDALRLVRYRDENFTILNPLESRDPLWITPYNERLLSHYARVTYADQKFSVAKAEVLGSESDRGIVHIRYGFPLEEMSIRAETVGSQLIPPSLLWVYPDFNVAFTDEFMNGNYQFSTPNMVGSFTQSRFPGYYETMMRGMFNRLPDRYQLSTKGGELPAYLELLDKRDHVDPFRFELLWAIPEPDQKKFASEWKFALFRTDGEFVRQIRTWYQTDKKTGIHRELNRYFSDQIDTQAIDGKFIGLLEGYHVPTQTYFRERIEKEIDFLPADSIYISDITIAFSASAAPQQLIPTPRHIFDKQERMGLEFFIANLKPQDNISNQVEIEYSLKYIPEETTIWEDIASVFTRDSLGQPVITFNSQVEYFSSKENIKFFIDMSKLITGQYELQVMVRDEQSGQSALKRSHFELLFPKQRNE